MIFKKPSFSLIVGAISLSTALSAFAVEEGDSAPDFSLPSIVAGQPAISMSELRGKTVYVDFWASWCAPCLKSLPLYNEMYKKYQDQGFEVVAINVDNPVEDGLDFLIDTPLDFLIPSDPDGETAELFQVIGMPTSYLISPDGTVELVHMGFRNGDMEIIESAIEKVLAGG
ncbi:MAG: cytochrome c biogenesis protein CcmG/thiol:disulfide interchange protein DsbE [Pseudohongiellaceae bacterium]|jgi:cytochrome c biogenesis protein CcmG/thiol:disulfide interchange protein DsbE